MLAPWKKSYDKPRQGIKTQRHHSANNSLYSQSYGLSNSHVCMWELDHKEGWTLKNWCFCNVLEKTLESPLESKGIKVVNLKGIQPWIFIQRTDAEAEAPILWREGLTHWKRPWCWERLKAREEGDWGQEMKGTTEDEMVGWHHWLNGHEFEQTLGDSEGQGSLICCSSWVGKE